MKIVDCNSSGLVFADETPLPWGDIGAIGKCEYPGRDLPWEFFYIRRKADSKNFRVPTLRRFSFLSDDVKDKNERLLRLKVFEEAKKHTHLRFVKKTTHLGKEHEWAVDSDIERDRFADSPEADRIRHEHKRNFRIVVSVVIVLFLALVLLGVIFGE